MGHPLGVLSFDVLGALSEGVPRPLMRGEMDLDLERGPPFLHFRVRKRTRNHHSPISLAQGALWMRGV